MLRRASLLAAGLLAAGVAQADPCGMVPPIWDGPGPAITRVGDQITYVFHKDGIESFVIRPGFSGKVDEFGMLIPFPTPPAIRKVEDEIFGHVAMAIDPPEVVVDLRPRPQMRFSRMRSAPMADAAAGMEMERKQGVRVIREEAVGMYEVAVLEAGSADALKRWLDDHGYRYPEGMESVTQDYVNMDWCFVAVKTRVGVKSQVTPKAGMREADASMPQGATFDGNVQAMGFRFKSAELVVPMRLSAFNAGELNNIVYALTDKPVRADGLGDDLVVRQVSGDKLYRNVTELLPLRVLGGTEADIPAHRRQSLPKERDPNPKNGFAKTLFAGDLLATRLGVLALPHEEREKVLLNIGERLGLRGPEMDAMHREALAAASQKAVEEALGDLKGMTLTVIDGEFDRDVIAKENIQFTSYEMSPGENAPERYDAVQRGPAPPKPADATVYHGDEVRSPRSNLPWIAIGLVIAIAALGAGLSNRSKAA